MGLFRLFEKPVYPTLGGTGIPRRWIWSARLSVVRGGVGGIHVDRIVGTIMLSNNKAVSYDLTSSFHHCRTVTTNWCQI
jgi:hypothetical protein